MEEGWALTEQGILQCIEMHQKVADGWTIEQVATYYEQDVLEIRVMLAMFYFAAEQNNIDLGIYIPDTIEGLDA